jgi:peptide/nickel transport system substrate-binding protein
LLLDPALATDPDSQMVNAYIYETLLRKDADGNLLPMLATSWVISDDRLDYIFELRPNVVFHDGTSLNADAVMTNFNRWFDPANPLHGDGSYDAWLAAFGGFLGELDENEEPKSSFDGIEKVNNLTVLIHLNRQDADFLSKMTELSFSFASPTAMQNAGAAYGTMEGGAAGTGAYTLSEWSEANLVLTPSASYWGTPASGNLVFGWK